MTASGWHRKNTATLAEAERRRRYNSREHRAARTAGTITVAAGTARCWRCRGWIPPGSNWHVGHSDNGTKIMGTEHNHCNLAAAASKGARTTNARRQTPRPKARRRTRNW